MNPEDFEPTDSIPEPIDTSPEEARLEAPATYSERYTEDDKAAVASIIEWLNAQRRTQVSLARQARITPETFSQVLRGKYSASPSKFVAKAMEAIANETERQVNAGIPFIETSVWRLARSIYHRARTYRNMGVFSGWSGTGKTTAALHYERTTPNVYVVECIEGMSASAFLDALIERLALDYETRGASKEKKFVAVVSTLRDTDSLLIVDEAENLGPETLEYCRRIRDLARIGVVLQGKQDLVTKLKPHGGRFDQIRSRIGFWPRTVQGISRSDADEIALAAFADLEEGPDRATLESMWDVCGGSIRVLTESLIPAVRDFGLRKGRSLNPQLVRQIASEALGMAPGTGRQGPAA